MAEGDVSSGGKGFGGFLKGTTAGLPNWAWVAVVAAGLAAAYFVPKFLNGGNSSNANNGTGGVSLPDSGIGLAVDPTTGLPYATEGLVPAGGTVGSTPPPAPGSTPPPNPPPPNPPPNPPPPNPPPTPQKFVHPQAWPNPQGSLSGIAAANGISLQRIEQLNPWIFQQRGTWNLIYTSDNIRVA